MPLKLGIIGLSEGNGHPYSWSAIFNGYEPEPMEHCGFPVIPRYLEQQAWPESRIDRAEVVAIWTQNPALSRKVAEASRIANVVNDPADMMDEVDALLLARDDAENHLNFAAPFLKAGLPVYIDKPVALSLKDLDEIYDLEQYSGQIFTCSALRYSKELELTESDRTEIGETRVIIATTPKSWDKYAVHVIEPVLKMLPENDNLEEYSSAKGEYSSDQSGSLTVVWKSGIQTSFFATGTAMTPISIRVMGTKGWKELVFTDSFSAFRAALDAFITGVEERATASTRKFNAQVVNILEKGRT